MKSSKSSVDFTLIAHLNVDAKFRDQYFSLPMLDLYLDFTKLTIEKAGSHTQIVPHILKSFSITVSCISV